MKVNELFSVKSERLFERLCELDHLEEAFKRVKKNKGSEGIDGISINSFEESLGEQLAQLSTELLNWSYKPMPVRRVEIPKPGSKEPRKLGVPAIRDRVMQTGIKMLLEPELDPTFSGNSYGFRPGRSQRDAIERAAKIVKSGKEYIVDIDLSKFFDRVNHDRLIGNLSKVVRDKRILRLIGLTLRSGVLEEGKFISTPEGTTQGSPLSPLLSNFVLDELDKELERRGLEFCRWADDCNIFVKSARSGERVLKGISRFIKEKLKLEVNWNKTKVAKSRGVKFLGFTVVRGHVAISQGALNSARLKLKELIPRGSHLPIEKTIEKYNEWYLGWWNYFKVSRYPNQFRRIEAHARRRMRSRIIGASKRKRFLVKKLRRQGTSKNAAFKTVYSPRGRWRLSNTRVLNNAFNIMWFRRRGMLIKSEQRLEHWFHVKRWA